MTFAGETTIHNVVDLNERIDTWYFIGRSLALAAGGLPEDFRVLGASSGSPIVIEFGLVLGLAAVVLEVIKRGLECVEKAYDIRLKAHELRQKKTVPEEALRPLEETADKIESDGAAEISAEMVLKLGLPDGEVKSAFESAVTRMFAFMRKGGGLDLVLPEP